MILSEFAGAAHSLNGSIVVNPWDSQQVADAIHEAVTMDSDVRAENHRKLFKYVNKYSAAFWGSSFIKEMTKVKPEEVDKEGQAELEEKNATTLVGGAVPLATAENAKSADAIAAAALIVPPADIVAAPAAEAPPADAVAAAS